MVVLVSQSNAVVDPGTKHLLLVLVLIQVEGFSGVSPYSVGNEGFYWRNVFEVCTCHFIHDSLFKHPFNRNFEDPEDC